VTEMLQNLYNLIKIVFNMNQPLLNDFGDD